jgi:NAD(P)-dependent dehydrogenase (short-subunit alcohol dehydrogenase family)
MLLTGRTALISGLASPQDIGVATARLFAAHGARVAILDPQQSAAEAAAAELGDGHLGLACDVTDRAACDEAGRQAMAAFGQLDILINNAGASEPLRLQEIEGRSLKRVLDTNLVGAFNLSQALMPYMRDRRSGAIACMSPVPARPDSSLSAAPYRSAAKAGVLGLAKAMAREFGPFGIRVNSVAPGYVRPQITASRLPEAVCAEILGAIPLGRLGSGEDIARIFLFLASDLSAYVTGAVIDVNGGMLVD